MLVMIIMAIITIAMVIYWFKVSSKSEKEDAQKYGCCAGMIILYIAFFAVLFAFIENGIDFLFNIF